jgi:hypothetical protein
MTKDEGLRLALEGAANYIDVLGGDSKKYRQLLAQPAPVQEPVACVIDGDLYFHHEIDWEDLAYQGHGVELLYPAPPATVANQQLTTEPATPIQEPPPECQTEAEKRAYAFGWWKALEANRAAPVQEPVAWVEKNGDVVWQNYKAAIGRNLYTTPPAAQRQWVGLTRDEVLTIGRQLGLKCRLGGNANIDFDYADSIEAKLKELNT